MTHNRVIQIIAVLGMVLCLAGGGALMGPIATQRAALQIDQADRAVRQASGQVVVTTLASAATGAFRGLAADILWYRANKLKDEGKFQEANQLSEWITTLQPSFAQVWVFNAWNMAYNISVATYTPQERWDWVSKGVNLLRDRGLRVNPRSVLLYKELGWIFFHKIGQTSDDMHWYYKQRLASEWQEVLGTPIDGATTQEAVDAFRPIVEAPDTVHALLTKLPELEPLAAELRSLGYELDTRLLRQIGRILMFNYSSDAAMLGLNLRERSDLYDSRLLPLLENERYAPLFPSLLAFLRKQALVNDYNMDPAFMLRLMEPPLSGASTASSATGPSTTLRSANVADQPDRTNTRYGFGPLDWRHPATHSLYWDALGTVVADRALNKEGVDLLNTYRGVIHSLQALTDGGRLNFDPISGHIDLLPDPRFVPAYEKAYLLALEDVARQRGQSVVDSYAAGYENFLLKAVVFYYLYGAIDAPGPDNDANDYYRKLREKYGSNPQRAAKYTQPLESLVLGELTENIDLDEFTRQFIDSTLARAFIEGLADNRMEVYERYVRLAQAVHARFQAKAVATPIAPQQRMALLPFDQIQTETFIRFTQSPGASLLLRLRVWRNAPLPLRQNSYDRLLEPMLPQLNQMGLDPAKAFAEPIGMEAIRQRRPKPPQGASPDATGPQIQRQ